VLTAQFAKSLAGNVAQIAGRITVARFHGFDGARAAASVAVETVLAILSAMVVAA